MSEPQKLKPDDERLVRWLVEQFDRQWANFLSTQRGRFEVFCAERSRLAK